jgi:cytochrome c oxidase subunit 4
VTVLAAHHNFGVWNTPIALAIAVVKAVLVILFFMHVKYSSRLTQLVVASGFFFLLILFAITLLDYLARGSVNPETRPAGTLQVDDK